MNKPIISLLIISIILISGCVSTVDPVDPSDIIVNVNPIEMKEFQEQEIAVNVMNNATASIDSVSVSSFDSFSVISGGSLNIPARTDKPSSVILNAKVSAPGFNDVSNTTTLTLSYASGIDDKGNPHIKTKSVPVQTVVLPDAKLQFVGFVKGLDNLRDAEVNAWEAKKGDNVTISFSVKNEGKTIIEENTTRVYVDMEKRMGSNNSLTIGNAMAKGGTSNTLGLQIRVPKDAPNGETEVFVTLKMGDKILDTKTLKFTVKL